MTQSERKERVSDEEDRLHPRQRFDAVAHSPANSTSSHRRGFRPDGSPVSAEDIGPLSAGLTPTRPSRPILTASKAI